MGSMKGKQAKIDAAFGRLADMINGGNLLASTDPVGFLDTAAAELKDLRAEIERLRDLLFARSAMNEPPCFCCGYNGQGYYQPSTHPCAERHHRLSR